MKSSASELDLSYTSHNQLLIVCMSYGSFSLLAIDSNNKSVTVQEPMVYLRSKYLTIIL